MPITPTEKIWMDGELVDWDDATVHVLTHTLHYGSGVFEGIRAYPTSRGPGRVPARATTSAACSPRPRSSSSTCPSRVERDRRGGAAGRARRTGSRRLLPPAARLPRLRRDGPQPAALPGQRVDRRVAVGRLPRRRGHRQRRPREDQLLARATTPTPCRPRPRAPACTSTPRWPRSRRCKAGYDEAILLATDGYVSECTGENIFIVRDGVLVTPPTSDAGALDGITQDSVEHASPATSATRCATSRIIRTDLYLADEAFLTGTAAEVVPIRAGRRPPGRRRATRARSPRRSSRPTSPPCAARWTGTRTGSTMSTEPTRRASRRTATAARHAHAHGHSAHAHDFSVPELPEAVDIFDTTLRDGSQQEGLSLTVDDKLRVAEQLDHLGVDLHRGRLAGRQPQGRRVLRRGPRRSCSSARRRWSPSGRPGGPGVRPETRRRAGQPGRRPARRWSASWPSRGTATSPRRCAPRSTRRWPWCADSVRYLVAHDLRVFLDAEHFFDGYRAQPRLRLRVLAAAEEAGAEALVLCDTNGGSLPDDVGAGGGRRARPHRARSSASTATTTPAAPWPTPSWPCRRARPRCRAASTATASGPATPTSRPPSRTCR